MVPWLGTSWFWSQLWVSLDSLGLELVFLALSGLLLLWCIWFSMLVFRLILVSGCGLWCCSLCQSAGCSWLEGFRTGFWCCWSWCTGVWFLLTSLVLFLRFVGFGLWVTGISSVSNFLFVYGLSSSVLRSALLPSVYFGLLLLLLLQLLSACRWADWWVLVWLSDFLPCCTWVCQILSTFPSLSPSLSAVLSRSGLRVLHSGVWRFLVVLVFVHPSTPHICFLLQFPRSVFVLGARLVVVASWFVCWLVLFMSSSFRLQRPCMQYFCSLLLVGVFSLCHIVYVYVWSGYIYVNIILRAYGCGFLTSSVPFVCLNLHFSFENASPHSVFQRGPM